MITSDLSGSVLRGVTQTMRKIGLGGKAEDGHAPNYLMMMNRPALAGRRDAACEVAVELFRRPLFSLPEPERIHLYESIVNCLEEATTAERMLPAAGTAEALPLTDYLRHVHTGVAAMLALLRQEQQLFEREKAMTQWLGDDFRTYLSSTEEVVNNVEVGLYHSLQELIDLAEKPFARLRDLTRKDFSQNELERYDKALNESREHYRARARFDAGSTKAPSSS